LGLTIRWADAALVYDSIPRDRLSWSWIIRRQYRLGNTYAVSERILGRRHLLIRRSIVGLARIGVGILMLPLLAASPSYGMRGASHLLRGAGMLVGLMGHSLEEYSPGRLGAGPANERPDAETPQAGARRDHRASVPSAS
jgi:hypothetical protein